MFDGTVICWIPTVPVPLDRKWRMRTAKFGDGYEQSTLDGINALESEWSLQWVNRPPDDLLAMDAYLIAEKGSAFPFRDPASGVLYNVVCREWRLDWSFSRRQAGQTIYYGTLSAKFTKANGITI